MGDSSSESVTLKVIIAFLLPLIVFIVSLAVSERVIFRAINIEAVRIALSLVLALIATFVYVFIAKIFDKQPGLNK